MREKGDYEHAIADYDQAQKLNRRFPKFSPIGAWLL
jgi:hypothetical protein